MYDVLSLRSHRVPSFGALLSLVARRGCAERRPRDARHHRGVGAILTVMAEDPGVRVPVIVYHAVMDDASRLGKYGPFAGRSSESDFKWLSENGYTAVLSEDLINYTEETAPRCLKNRFC